MSKATEVERESVEWTPPREDWGWGDLPILDQFRNCTIDDNIEWLAEIAELEQSPSLAAAAVALREKVQEIDEWHALEEAHR